MRKVSIIIPLRNSEKDINQIFSNLTEAKIPRDLTIKEVILVDNGSTDGTFVAAQNLISSIQYSTSNNIEYSILAYKRRTNFKDAGKLGAFHAKSNYKVVIKSDLSDLTAKLNRISRRILAHKKAHIPTISVVMPVFNAEKYLSYAVNSIMKQTYKDFEFIIVDDASTDRSYQILEKFAKRHPDKIRLFRNEKNLKQAKSVNFAIQKARGDYIARMDADDISLPTRFEKQIEYLKKNKKTIAVGSQCLIIDAKGRVTGEKTFPTTHEEIYDYIFKFCPAQQPSLMIAKKRLPRDFEYYDHDLSPVEDTEFIFKLFKYGRVENMPDYFLLYRIHGENSSLMNFRKSFALTFFSRMKAVVYHGYRPTPLGVFFTLAQAAAVFFLPKKISNAAYMLVKSKMEDEKVENKSNKRLAYRLAKSL